MKNTRISIIIVSYNVRPYLINVLESLKRALTGLTYEIIVIDNASTDESVKMLEERYPEVTLIANARNAGFAAANNQGLAVAEGRYLVLINPDTLVQEDTFTSLLAFMEAHPRAGAATCKILNPDGSFSIDSRHSIPSPMTAFWKQIGFSRLFPRSHIFARYNMTFLDENQSDKVDAISGAFMFLRAVAFRAIGPFDEDYFMYCEDVDYCYRIGQSGWEIYYIPDSSIIHYKGESTRKADFSYAVNFNQSLYLFYTKHFQEKYFPFLKVIILTGVFFRGFLIYIKNMVMRTLRFLLNQVINLFPMLKTVRSKRGVLLVCAIDEAKALIKRLEQGARTSDKLFGLVTLSESEVGQIIADKKIVTTLDGLSAYRNLNRVGEIIFSPGKISYKQIIRAITHPALRQKECQIIPPGSNLIISKGKVTEFN